MDFFLKSVKRLIKSCDCDRECKAKRFKQNFKNWTSGNNYVDKFIQNTQLLDHGYYKCDALEWIPYDRLYNIKYIVESDFGKLYSAKWCDGCISGYYDQNWRRYEQNMSVTLNSLNDPINITLKFINEITAPYKIYGITRDLETRNYMIVFDTNKCRKCERKCNAVYFRYNFNNWTSGNYVIDKFIQNIQLSDHSYYECDALEWIPYDKLYNIKYIEESDFGKVYSAKWYDGYVSAGCNDQNWRRFEQNMSVTLNSLNDPTNITLELINEITAPYKIYGITRDLETRNRSSKP
ncbi:hypothetical protein RclHR1_06520010 [Rhizophagus clarus]|uniref:Uncharacterized protein n=1 Tax=Rhizophagus clarus TaxID=94130 RepID=A0A2Z6RT70_9GLOM|nr:hypothetical protein RclHR1_06520010 [Rhizophagus clarus]